MDKNKKDTVVAFQGKAARKQAYQQQMWLHAPAPRREVYGLFKQIDEAMKTFHEEIQQVFVRAAVLEMALVEGVKAKPWWMPGFLWRRLAKPGILKKEQIQAAYATLQARAAAAAAEKKAAEPQAAPDAPAQEPEPEGMA